MNCIDAQRLIMPFINDELDIKQLEDFIHHVRSCSNCMEELEVYYVLLAGMKQLDEDKELSTNFHQDLIELLKISEERIVHYKLLHIRKRIILVMLISLFAVLSSLQLGEYVVDDVLNNGAKESNFLMENLFVVNKPADFDHINYHKEQNNLSRMVIKNLDDIYVYLRITDPEGAKIMEEKFGTHIWDETIINNGVGLKFRETDWIINSY
jgi:hypothetical protein